MKRIPVKSATRLKINNCTQGDSIEYQMERILNNELEESMEKELQYTKTDDVIAITDIRSDKFEMAIEETMKVTESEKKALEIKRQKRAETLKIGDNAVGGQSADTTVKTT